MKKINKYLIVFLSILTLCFSLFISNNIYASENIENTEEYKQGFQDGIESMKKEYINSLAFINEYNISNIHLEHNNLSEDYDTSYLTTYTTYNSLRLDFKYVYLDWVEYISTDYLPECHITFSSPIPCYGIDDFLISSSIREMVFELDNGRWVYGVRYEKESGSDTFYIDTTPLRDLTNLIQQVYIILDDITLPTGIFLDFIKEEYNIGYNYGYDNGYSQGKSDYESNIKNTLKDYYNKGYDSGLLDGFQNGLNDSTNNNNNYNSGFNAGYDKGLIDSDNLNAMPKNFINALFSTPINIFKNFLNFDFFGINLFSVFTSLLTIFLVLFLFKRFKK